MSAGARRPHFSAGFRGILMRNSIAIVILSAILLTAAVADAGEICGDVNDNGQVSASDALQVLRKSVDQPVELDCGPTGPLAKTGDTIEYGKSTDGAIQAGTGESFRDNLDGTITDNRTGLMWEKKDNSGGIHDQVARYLWCADEDEDEFCDNENDEMDGSVATVFLATLNADSFAGYDDWRLPNAFELYSLTNLGEVVPATYAAFHSNCTGECTVLTCSCTSTNGYWSSTTYLGDSRYAWNEGFASGNTDPMPKPYSQRVRAVRDPG